MQIRKLTMYTSRKYFIQRAYFDKFINIFYPHLKCTQYKNTSLQTLSTLKMHTAQIYILILESKSNFEITRVYCI